MLISIKASLKSLDKKNSENNENGNQDNSSTNESNKHTVHVIGDSLLQHIEPEWLFNNDTKENEKIRCVKHWAAKLSDFVPVLSKITHDKCTILQVGGGVTGYGRRRLAKKSHREVGGSRILD